MHFVAFHMKFRDAEMHRAFFCIYIFFADVKCKYRCKCKCESANVDVDADAR